MFRFFSYYEIVSLNLMSVHFLVYPKTSKQTCQNPKSVFKTKEIFSDKFLRKYNIMMNISLIAAMKNINVLQNCQLSSKRVYVSDFQSTQFILVHFVQVLLLKNRVQTKSCKYFWELLDYAQCQKFSIALYFDLDLGQPRQKNTHPI